MKVYINSEPQVNPGRTVASCFVGFSTKDKDSNTYIRQTGRLVGFGDNVGVLEAFSKGADVDIVVKDFSPVPPTSEYPFKDRDGNPVLGYELVFGGFAGAPAASKPKAAKARALDTDEIPF